MPHSGGGSAGEPIGSDGSDNTSTELSASMHDACAHTGSAHACTKTGLHVHPATGVAVDSATCAELAEAWREAHAHKQANRELQRRIAELEQQHATPLTANAAHTGMDLPSSTNSFSTVRQAELTTNQCE